MKYNMILSMMILMLFSCCQGKDKNDLVVYPEYCHGCIIRNFSEIKNRKLENEFNIYFDTTDSFLREYLEQNKLTFHHINNSEIPEKFGDYANIVVVDRNGKTTELKTNETITKGVHF